MVLEILLIISVILQLVAATVAIGLTRRTKYNFSWILFTIALSCMAFLRFGEYVEVAGFNALRLPPLLNVWIGVATSLCFAVGVLLVQRIFTYIYVSEQKRRLSERRILNTVIRTEEVERQRFSRELHDGLGPLLSSARMSLSALSTDSLDQRNLEIIRNTNMVLDEAVRSLREVATNLSPHILNDFGLARAITSFINKLTREGLKVNFTTNLRGERFDRDVEVVLYRVICELLNNSFTHSSATEITLSIEYSESLLHLHYRDNGCGFDPKAKEHTGMGISNMSSRVGSIKGEFRLMSAPGQGMEAVVNIHIKK